MRIVSILFVLLLVGGCRQQMATQPSYRPFRESSFFPDRRASRPLVPGTVARGSKVESGMKTLHKDDWGRLAGIVGALGGDPLTAASWTADLSFHVDAFPEPITHATLQRGQQRYDIFCSVCHDRVGTGRGMIVQRGFTPPPSLLTDHSRGLKRRGADVPLSKAPVGYYFEVITHGYGAMPSHGAQVEAKDRWAIIAHIRALQFSQSASLNDVRDAAEKDRLQRLKGGTP